MKKPMIFAICLMVLVWLPALGLAAPASDQDAKQLMNQYVEAWKKLDSGIDYYAFRALRQDLSMATQTFKEKYPQAGAIEDFDYLNRLYTDLEETWQLKAEQKLQFLPKTNEQGKARGTGKYFIHTVTLRMHYPSVLDASLESKENGYFINSVLDNFFAYADRMTTVVKANVEKGLAR